MLEGRASAGGSWNSATAGTNREPGPEPDTRKWPSVLRSQPPYRSNTSAGKERQLL